MIDCLFKIMGNLSDISVKENADVNGKRMSSIVVVICCLDQVLIKSLYEVVPPDYASNLLYMLKLQPDIKSRKCLDWDNLNACIPNHYKKVVIRAICRLFSHLVNSQLYSKLEWLYAIPILHFLRGDLKPFQQNVKMSWKDDLISPETLNNLKSTEESRYAYRVLTIMSGMSVATDSAE